MNAYRDIVNAIRTAEKKKYADGLAEGLVEGELKRAREIVARMKAAGMSDSDIMQMTGLSLEEIAGMQSS